MRVSLYTLKRALLAPRTAWMRRRERKDLDQFERAMLELFYYSPAVNRMLATLYLDDANAPDGGHWPHAHMNSYGFTIAAGSNEIQRNILGERVLGLAKSK